MTWHTSPTTTAELPDLVTQIRRQGGFIASCLHVTTGLVVTWFTL